jgi:hypothetical protein
MLHVPFKKSTSQFCKVIMDEVGRGTTVQDGLAIAFAAVHHLVTTNRSRSLFATHFHELADMLGYQTQVNLDERFGTIDFFCTSVAELGVSHLNDDDVVYINLSLEQSLHLRVPCPAWCKS